jgi:hypothetical protein
VVLPEDHPPPVSVRCRPQCECGCVVRRGVSSTVRGLPRAAARPSTHLGCRRSVRRRPPVYLVDQFDALVRRCSMSICYTNTGWRRSCVAISHPVPGGTSCGARPALRCRRKVAAAPERAGVAAHAGGADDQHHARTDKCGRVACRRCVDRIRPVHPRRRPKVSAARTTHARVQRARGGHGEKRLPSCGVRGTPTGTLQVDVAIG